MTASIKYVAESRKRRKHAGALRGERGQSMVEYALVLPIFLIMLFGIIDFGWMGYQLVSFEYAYMNASWDSAASGMVNYDYASPTASSIPSGVASDILYQEVLDNALPGFDEGALFVSVESASLSNVSGTYTVPDREGNESTANSVKRNLSVRAEVSYTAAPLVGFSSFSTTKTKNLEFSRQVGEERRG